MSSKLDIYVEGPGNLLMSFRPHGEKKFACRKMAVVACLEMSADVCNGLTARAMIWPEQREECNDIKMCQRLSKARSCL